jgi:hypothetical protein
MDNANQAKAIIILDDLKQLENIRTNTRIEAMAKMLRFEQAQDV